MRINKFNFFAVIGLAFVTCLFFLVLGVNDVKAASNNFSDIDGGDQYIAGVNPLMTAVTNDDIEGVKFFISSDSLLINQKNLGGATSLNIACRNGNLEIARILVNNGANVNLADNEGWTSLMRASFSGNSALVDYLLVKGANPSKHNIFNETAIIHAAHANCYECVDLLLNKHDIASKLDGIYLQEQIKDAYAIFRNRNNKEAQKLLANYLVKIGGSKIAEFNPDSKDLADKKPDDKSYSSPILIPTLSGDLPDSKNNIDSVLDKKPSSSYKFNGKKFDDAKSVVKNEKSDIHASPSLSEKRKFKIKSGAASIIKDQVVPEKQKL